MRRLKASNEEGGNKFTELDDTLKKIERKLKEGNVLEQGKVSAMAAHLANMNQEPEKPPLQKSVSIRAHMDMMPASVQACS